ncbi:unnamed protein product [Sphagnum jensenii]|uniref:AP2/ERF domain-containing protein n=1 Tax=Sphagnum jensenii TaxID=128206 RepID=A0ABP1BVP7_9BRYO
MVSIRKRRPGGLSPDKHGQPQAYQRLPFLLSARETTLASPEVLKSNEDIPPKQVIWSSDLSLKSLHAERELKKRKHQRRKQQGNQEPCVMRGVYFKNMKWQAAIKVEKKQVHLGTVGSQEEAARLYDRAAYMCGREPNFELSEEDKLELQGFQWDEFLELTRKSILNKSKFQFYGSGGKRKTKTWMTERLLQGHILSSSADALTVFFSGL